MQLITAFRNLFRNIRRSTAILLTIALGIAALFSFDGFNIGIMNQYRDNTIHARYGDGQINEAGYRNQVYQKPWEHWIANWKELESFLKNQPTVQHVFPRVTFYALLTNGKQTISGLGQGIDGNEESKFFNALNIEQGVTLRNEPDGILLGIGLARALNVNPGDVVTVLGNTINGTINGLDLIVTGIFHTGSQDFDNSVFRIPLKSAMELLDTDKVESVALGLRHLDDWNETQKVVENKFPQLEATPFSVLDKVYYQHSVDWLKSQFYVIQIIILTIVLLGIFNSVSTSILERKSEIGNLRANGESIFDVVKLLLYEGLALGIIGSLLGILIALFINYTLLKNGILMPPAPGLTRQFHVMIELQPATALFDALLGILTAFFATLFVGIRVARTPIGQALKSV